MGGKADIQRHGELDTAVNDKLPLLCVINLNGGWASNPKTTSPAPDLGPIGEASDYYAAWGQGRRGRSRLCQRQDRLPRPRHHPCGCPAGRSEPALSSRQGRLWAAPFFSLPAEALLRVLRRTDPRLGTPENRAGPRICLDGYQRRAVDRDEYIEIKAGARHLIGPGTVVVEGVSYWDRR